MDVLLPPVFLQLLNNIVNSRTSKMALGKKAYPKATVKKIVKAHSGLNLKKNADVTVSRTWTRWDVIDASLTSL